ncbi:transmembrane GTPase Marf-like [Tropilaelaps mercedesae]|uniref:Transmembrane GTPase Marf-like n=1 Tax=Tropilaelaps mercedesae TaxID=418985 RepID=A0A1V9X007_9ACAR|nr:transmembrane GTPase Marf-like [Tropilaelaps mercedesae]
MSGSIQKMIQQSFGAGDAHNGSNPKVSGSIREHLSPLKLFVQAKKDINIGFGEIAKYVADGHEFLATLNDELGIIDPSDRVLVAAFRDKVRGIRDVLARDHMKCVFFGRTSNGKSTVINAMLQEKILPSGLGHTTNCFLQVEGSKSGDSYLTTEGSTVRQNVGSVQQLANALNGESLDHNALEKKFFHKVSEKLSTPNVFILNNRWDASANEPESMEMVRKQHLERNIAFLVDELKVYSSRAKAEERVFFVSAREVLDTRIRKLRGDNQSGVYVEGYQGRYFEFEDFERKFEKCLSETAVKTKFQQHCERGYEIVQNVLDVMDKTFQGASNLRKSKQADRDEHSDKLEFTKQQMAILTDEVKHRIEQLVEQVECQVTQALSEEIRRLNVLVMEYERPFHPDPALLNVYKKELHTYVEKGLGSNLKARLNVPLQCSVETSQKEMVSRLAQLIPEQLQTQMQNALPRNHFEPLYRLNCDSLCGDFQEDLEFRFSLGITALVNRFLGPRRATHPLFGQSPVPRPLSSTPATPGERAFAGDDTLTPLRIPAEDYLAIVSKLALLSPTSQTAVGVLALAGLVIRAVGWRVIVVSLGAYGLVYAYERMTWTSKAKEKTFKKQYVRHASSKLKLIVELTSSNCSHQVQQELSGTFARLGHLVDEVVTDIEADISRLDVCIAEAEEATEQARILKNQASFLKARLEQFSQKYLHQDE